MRTTFSSALVRVSPARVVTLESRRFLLVVVASFVAVFTVLAETPIASAVSSFESPAK